MKKRCIKQMMLISILTLAFLPVKAQWTQVWADEFTSNISGDWVYDLGGGGWGNNELQYYRSQNASVVSGALQIQARRESYGGLAYTSARMKTQGRKSWKYGKIEARISIPSFTGVWPAFWMLGDNITSVGWPACGEIDIMEHVNTGSTVYGTIHWDYNGYASYGGNTTTSVTSYHNYTIEWNANEIKWFVDGAQFHVANIAGSVNGTNEFHNNFFIILNMAIGGNWPGFTVDNNAFPANMRVDYVRVFTAGTTPPPPPPPPTGWSQTIQAESYSSMSGVATEGTTDAGGGLNVGWIEANDWMAYPAVNIPAAGTYTIEYRVASLNGGGNIQFERAGGSPIFGTRTVASTGGWQTWTTIKHTVTLAAGSQSFAIKALAGGFNINWFTITQGVKAAEDNSSSLVSVAELSLYPNPANEELHINNGSIVDNMDVKIYSMSGSLMLQQQIANDEAISLESLQSGIYVVKVTTGSDIQTKLFTKN